MDPATPSRSADEFCLLSNRYRWPTSLSQTSAKGFPNQLGRFEHEGKELLSVDNVDALMAMIQISAIEFHPWGCRADRMDRPDRMVLDLDPDTTVPWSAVIEAGMNLRQSLEDAGLQSWVKTTGGKGLHLVVALSRRHTWEQMFSFSKQFAEQCAKRWPKVFVSTMAKKARVGRIFIDYHRNHEGATAVGPIRFEPVTVLLYQHLSLGMNLATFVRRKNLRCRISLPDCATLRRIHGKA